MATKTLGTTANNSLTALQFQPGLAPADLAAINATIYRDNNPAYNSIPVSEANRLDADGQLSLPGGRGIIILRPGDWIAVDPTTGWPIVVSTNCATNGAIVHT